MGSELAILFTDLLSVILKRQGDWWNTKLVIIIDEAQMSYRYGSLWNDYLKTLSSGPGIGPMVILFSSYGSSSMTPLPKPTPVQFFSRQRLSIRPHYNNNCNVSLYYTRAEFDDLISRYMKDYPIGQSD